ncbi:basic salivary proline-rich protein 2-like isoform X2 [Pogoniulus pusillus]|uniref:basic salivary proline-rich protein 2-like isoform X2 n=1 Tax=Pogoniulus pusillus TaxID=488313 RepID=UPI0030B9451D
MPLAPGEPGTSHPGSRSREEAGAEGTCTPDPSQAILALLGMRKMRDGHPTTGPHHAFGMTLKAAKNLRTSQRIATRSLALTAFTGLNAPGRSSTHPGPHPPRQGKQPHSKPGLPEKSQEGVTEKPQQPGPPQTLTPSEDGAQSKEQTAQSPPEVNGKVSEPPRPARPPEKSPDTDAQAVPEAAELEQAAAATLVKPGTRQQPAGSHNQSPSALETEAAPPEKSSAGPGEPLQVELCSQSVPQAGAGDGSQPHSPAAPPELAKKVCMAAGSTGEVGAGLCPHSQGQQHVPSGTGEAEGEAAHSELLSGLQPPGNLQVPPEATLEADAEPSQACSSVCTTPETSPQTLHPPGSSETKPTQAQGAPQWSPRGIPESQHRAAGSQPQLGSKHPTASPASTDLRSAAILARKQEIELSYQQFSLTIAVVATMLLQKEPSMEASLGLALRANLRQGRIHHLRELENFISSYDSATLSHQNEGTGTSISPAPVWGMTEDPAGASGCL